MKNNNKLFIIFLISLFFLINISFGEILDEDIKIENITPSIQYIEKTRLTNNKWIIIKSLIIDISDENTEITTLFNDNNLKTPKALTNLSKETNNIIGAINGDFFNYIEKTAIGPIINNENLVYNGTVDSSFNIFGLTTINTPFIANFKKIDLIARTKNKDIKIDYKNKDYMHHNSIVLIDKHFSNFSIGNNSKTKTTEIIVKNNKIEDIRYNMKPILIPENGFIIAIPDSKKTVLSNININDEISIIYPKITEFIKTAIGGGSILVKNGEVNSNFSLKINGVHPRSAIGVSKDKSQIILTTVEGRKSGVPGVTQTELANIMIDLGANYALNLDGGGSSTLAVREFGINELKTLNYLSDGIERKIYNGIGIISNYKINNIENIETTLNNDHSVINNPIELKVLATDKYYNPIKVPINEIEFSSTLKGNFIDNIFYPKEIGKGYIITNYKGIINKNDITIHDNISEIKLSNYHLLLKKGESITLNPILISNDGYEIPVKLNLLDLDIDKNLIKIEDEKITLLEKTQDQIITISYNTLTTEFDLNMNNYNTTIIDDFENIKGNSEVYPLDLVGRFSLFNSSLDNTHSGKLFYDFTKHPEKTRASYYVYNKPILIEESAEKIGLEVFGALGKDHWLRVKISDSSGNSYNLTLARNINWDGWKYIETEMPNNISKPIKIEKIYLVETDISNTNSGLILIDNLQVKTLTNNNLTKKTNYKDIFSFSMDLNYNQDNLYFTNKDDININSENFKILTDSKELFNKYPLNSLDTNESYNYINDKSKLILNLNNKNSTLLNNNGNQWLFLKKHILNDSSKNLLINLSDKFIFNNSLEKELFFSYLDKHKQKNNSNIFIISNNNKFKLTYYKGYPIINLNTNESYSLKFNFFNDSTKFKIDTPKVKIN
ncbi:MAG: phosphodiester glycosidase family protein [Bacillota bacterium]|nr:phosphodiester glycosidase family protein [Bacillota bacterium]